MPKKPIHLASIDFETTGLNPETDQIIEIGAVKFTESGEVIDTFQILAKPTIQIHAAAQKVHGISADMLKDAVSPKEAWEAFLAWAGDVKTLVAHNAQFEGSFIRGMYSDSESLPEIEFICTLKLSRKRLKEESSHKLDHLVPGEGRHRALADAEACVTLYQRLADTYASKKVPIATHATPLSEYKTFKEPSSRQLSYIKSLGGDPSSVRTSSEASQFIETLKARADETKSNRSTGKAKTSEGAGVGTIVVIVIVISIVLALTLAIQSQ